MSLLGLSPAVFALGLAGIAGLLVLLQILRVRHAATPVVTTMFWDEALEESRARIFRRVFRHLPAWLLIFSICALLWLAFAQPEVRSSATERTVLVLDASAGMQWGTRFEDAKRALLEHVEEADADGMEVLVDAGGIETLLAPGEDRLLLARRLMGVTPVASPTGLPRLLRRLAAEAPGPLRIRVFGDAPFEAEGLPAHVETERARTGAREAYSNAGITGFGIAESASGANDRVDVFLEVRATSGQEVPAPQMLLEQAGGASPVALAQGEAEAGRVVWRAADVLAAGGVLRVSVADEAGLGLDDRAAIRLPGRKRIRAALSEALRPTLLPALAADPRIEVVEGSAGPVDVYVGSFPDQPVFGPQLTFSGDAEGPTLTVFDTHADNDGRVQRVADELELAAIDGAQLAERAGREINVVVVNVSEDLGSDRSIHVWKGLLAPDLGFTSSRAFPLFLSHALRWLVSTPTRLRPLAAAGEVLGTSSGTWVREDGASHPHATAGADFLPPRAGPYHSEGGEDVSVSLLDASLVATGQPAGDVEASGGGSAFSWAGLCMLLALLLLGGEWFLFRTGRMP